MKRKHGEVEASDGTSSEEESRNETVAEAPAKAAKKSKSTDHDFSSQEITRLKETEALFHSSLFRLQMTELLKEVSVRLKLKTRLEEATEALTEILKNLPTGKEHKIMDRKWLESKAIKIPVVERPSHVKGSFQFLPPSDIRLAGSVVLDTMVKPDVQADLVLQMPKACFHAKDYLNQRYTRKRALYLSAIASRLCKKTQVEDLKFTYFLGNPHKPMLVVTFKGQDAKNVKICLHAVPEKDIFKLSRFHVTKNNVRPRWFFEKQELGAQDGEDDDSSSLPATPFYNCSILQDLCSEANDQFVEKMLRGSDGLCKGIMLLKVWLRQRELLKGAGAFSSHLMTAFVVYLLMTKKLNKMMNSYQVFRTTLLYLSKADWILEPPSLFEDKPEKMQPTVDQFREADTCVFVDRTGYFNMAYMLTPSVFARVKDEARLSLEALDQHHQNCFDILFMTPVSFTRRFDHIFHITVSPQVLQSAASSIEELSNKELDLGGHCSLALSHHILMLLSKALDKRVTLLQTKTADCKMWEISDEPYSHDDTKFLTFGMVLDATSAFNILDRGPLADSAEAKEFRDFWADKSEMRRFKDGTIHEAVLWTNSSNQSDRRLVCKRIVQYILSRHCGIPKSSIHYMAGKLDPLLQLTLTPKTTGQSYGTGEEQSLAVHHAFEHVNRAVRALTTLPLGIHSVQGIHPVFRHADVFPSLPAPDISDDANIVSGRVIPKEGKSLPQFVPALEVICMLEGSGKWPEEIDAIQCMKTLLHIKMGTELKEKHLFPVSEHKTHVDVVKNGHVFRLKIANTRELAVLRTVKTESGMIKFKDTTESNALEREIVSLPHLTQLLHGIQQEHPAFSATVRLCKRWIASQMLWGLLREEVVELMVAYMFISPHPYSAPASPSCGLMRFLHLLSSFNWKADPLMVNLNKEFTEEDFANIPKEFAKNRATLPSMCISTPHDKHGTKWTRPLPTEAFLQRLILLAREALKVLESQVMKQFSATDFKQIFRPPLEHYDVLIRLLRKANAVHHQAVDGKNEIPASNSKEGKKSDSQPIPVTDFNAARKFFIDLQTVFGDLALFFHDPYGGSVIGMVWKPQALEKREFKSSQFLYRKPIIDENETVSLDIQKESILDDIRVMGGGIVESITASDKSSS